MYVCMITTHLLSVSIAFMSFYSFVDKTFNTSDCGGYGLPNTSACSSIMWELVNSSVYAPEPYTGSACSSYLLSWRNCAIGPSDSDIILINATVDQAENEQLAVQTLQLIS